jgi:hypothetical protein
MKSVITNLAAALMFFAAIPCWGGGSQVDMFFKDKVRYEKEIVSAWAQGNGRPAIANGFKGLLRAESALIAYGVPWNDPRLIMHELEGLPPTEVERFALRIFLKKLKNLGVAPEGAEATFTGRKFRVTRVGTGNSFAVRY